MKKLQILQRIVDSGIVPIIRVATKEKALKVIEAIRAGGIHVMEVTMTVPGALEVLETVAKKDEDILLGAGTVLDPETARACILAGAKFIISPNLNPEVIKLCNRYSIPVIPGIMTIKEAIEAMELGVDILKFFPGSAFNPSMVKAINGPLPQANIMPTGGVSLENVGDWIKNGSVAVGVGGTLTAGAKTGDYQQVTEVTKQFVQEIKRARQEV